MPRLCKVLNLPPPSPLTTPPPTSYKKPDVLYLKGHGGGESSERQRKKDQLFLGLEQSWGGTDAWTVGLVALGSMSTLDSLPILVGSVEGEVLEAICKFWEGSVKEETNVTAVLG